MNYNLKQLLGKHDPKLLRIRQEISWLTVNSLAQAGEFEALKSYIKHQMTLKLADALPLEITETPLLDALELTTEVYVFSPAELSALLSDSYNLGSADSRVMPAFSNF